jgi:hypothetical protein
LKFRDNPQDIGWLDKIEKILAVNKIRATFNPKDIERYDIKNEKQLQKYITNERRKRRNTC